VVAGFHPSEFWLAVDEAGGDVAGAHD